MPTYPGRRPDSGDRVLDRHGKHGVKCPACEYRNTRLIHKGNIEEGVGQLWRCRECGTEFAYGGPRDDVRERQVMR